jgi:hypothetical protein
MKKKEKTAFYLRWNYWLILALIIIVGVFSWSEKEIEQKQPSAEWSMGIRLLEDLPTDERKISFRHLTQKESPLKALRLSMMIWKPSGCSNWK